MIDPTRIIVVTGFPRSGTSLVLQMLNAAGVRCAGSWPGFEPEETCCVNATMNSAFIESMQGGAIKLLDPQIIALPTGFLYDFIWMRRDKFQQARSIIKFVRASGNDADPRMVGPMRKSLLEDVPRAQAALRKHEGHRWFDVSFETLIKHPSEAVRALAEFLCLDGWVRMAACVQPRTTDCLPYMLELEQLADARAKV